MDLTHMNDDVKVVRRALLGVIEMQEHETTILQDIQQSLAVLAGRAQAAPSPVRPGAWPMPYPPFSVPPVTGVFPYVAPSTVAIVSLGMLLSGGVRTGSSLQVPIQTVFTQSPLQVAVTTQPAVSQPVQPQGTQPQQLAQQPVSTGLQPGVVQGPGQTQWVPKTAIAAPKPFTGDKRGEYLDTWLRAVPVYVRCKLTLPHEEVLVAASYLEGSAARWLSGLVQLQGHGHDFRSWAASQKLEDFLKMVEVRWHDPQEAQKATDAILKLHTRQLKLVREATDAVERLICVPGVGYDPQVLLTSYLRCLSQPLRNQLAKEANINMHNFPSFNKVALDLEAKIGHGQTPTTDGRKKTLPPNWKAKGRIMFVDNDGSTIELDGNFQEGVGADAGGETSEGGVVAAISQQKAKGTGRRRGGSRSRNQVDPNAPPWEKAGLSEDVWRDRWNRQTCIRCGQYGHSQFKCRNKKVTDKIPPTMGQVVGSSSPVGSNVASSSGTAPGNTYDLYEFVVMPFGLCNAPDTFQHAMNRLFHDYLDKFVIVYLDDILIFSKIVEEHAAHLDKVLSLLRQHKFKINGEKCEFGRPRVLYLGHEISAEGLKPDDAKVTSIRDWPRPQFVTEMRSFLGMTGYYRTFVKNYSIVAAPLTDLTRLDTPWEWTEECEAAFRHLKHALTHYEVLKLPDPYKPFIVTTDASQYGIGAVLAQQEGPKSQAVNGDPHFSALSNHA
ncbi:hypothetical protein CBR_g37608 [Chara braunii]|uniref:CCHC-type domain-containing protein n=1 Tax=Chara braunii TaxID=69332 RepID=A0A388LNB6_CHABU|nr:hypothetical protein CBR_g37608 [Chara braunii]|eukprot:GBG83808.1 hypothetical protein CBR_g37608 [Chara braunii]